MLLKFENSGFSCDVEKYTNEESHVLRFFDKEKEHKEENLINYVLADPGFGFLSVKYICSDGFLLTGFLDAHVFDEILVEKVIEFVESIFPELQHAFVPHNILLVNPQRFVTYDGET